MNKSKRTRKSHLKNNNLDKIKRKGSTSRNTSCLSFTCINDAVAYLKLLKDKAANYEKQVARVTRQGKTGSGKAGKKGLFGPVVRRIVENGGGNASDLKCNGVSNAGSAQLTNLTETLLKCEDEIHKGCHPDNLPQTNMTEIKTCNEAITSFKETTGKCIKKSGSDACACWTDETLVKDAAIIKKCDLSDYAKSFAKALKNCTSAFGKCRKFEDDVPKAIHACNIDTNNLKKKLKNLQANSEALTSLQNKLNATASTRTVGDVNDRAITCSAFISTSATVVSLVSQNPVSYSIFTLIQSVISVTFTCTDSEKIAIKSVSSSVSQAMVMVQAEVTHTKEVYASVNGEEVSDADIAAASLCKTEDECDSLIEFPEETTPTTTTMAVFSNPGAPSPAAASSALPSTVETSSAAPAASTSVAPASAASLSPTPSLQTAVSMTSVSPSPEGTSPSETSPPAMTSPAAAMTTASSTRRARRYGQHLMRRRMVQTLI